jgi:transposase-like protein
MELPSPNEPDQRRRHHGRRYTGAIGALQVDEAKLRGHVDEVVRSSVEETLNGLLDAEADQIRRAQRYERSPERVDSRAGHYERKLETKAGEMTLRVPKERRVPFESAIVERYKRRESSVEEALERSEDETEWSGHSLTDTPH